MSIIGSNILAGASGQGGSYKISRSVRLRSSATAYLNRTQTTGSQTTWTWSAWVKLGNMSGLQYFFDAGGSSGSGVLYNVVTSEFQIEIGNGTTQYYARTSAVFRDPSAWYHIVAVADTTNATSTNRLKLFVNGVQQTIGTSSYPTSSFAGNINQNTIVANIGRWVGANYYFDGYLTEINFIDGQALTPSSFGQTNSVTGVWQPIKYTGTYGTNGFYLNFSDNSSNTATTIGKDYSGNGNNWTPNNISVTAGATYDSMLDVPTLYADGGNGRGNYAVMNPLSNIATDATLSNGNLAVAYGTSATIASAVSTMSMTTGKWYMEMQITATSATNPTGVFGIQNQAMPVANYPGFTATSYGLSLPNGNKVNNSSGTAYGSAFVVNDIAMMAVDMVAGKVWWGKNGTWFNSGNPATNTNEAFSGLPSEMWVSVGDGSTASTSTMAFNFGQQPFTYTPPTGFVALNTQNLPTPTISNGANYMAATTYTGDGTSTRSITNGGNNPAGITFQPDFVWIKERDISISHTLFNSVVGAGANKGLASDTTDSESSFNDNATFGYLSAFNSNGFSVVLGSTGTTSYTNKNAGTYVAWQWKAGTTSSSNTSGSITSTVSANPTAGFSVVTFTAQASGTGTFGHGLGVAPSMVIVKQRASAGSWGVYHISVGNGSRLLLDSTAAAVVASSYWNNTSPTSTVVTLGTGFATAGTMVAYCFAEVAGYSKFGSYTGNGSADGPFVFTNFQPRWVMVKRTDSTSDWYIWDTSRDTYNVESATLLADTSGAETSAASIDGLSNGFKCRSATIVNASGGTYIYAAFASNPMKYSLGR